MRPATAWRVRCAAEILVLCIIQPLHAAASEPRPARVAAPGVHAGPGNPRLTDLKFTHLTTNDGLSQGYVVDILQDRRGFMWFATRDGLNRYDGYSFVVYKHDPNDPGSLNSNFIQDLMEDDHGDLWVATNTGVNRFDPTTERCTRYVHDPDDPRTLGGGSVKSVTQDHNGNFWFGTEDSGLDRLDGRTGGVKHHRTDGEGRFVGRITQVIEDRHGDIWFAGERGLFHLHAQTGQIARRPAGSNNLSVDSVFEDEAGDLWMLASSPVVGVVRYDRRAERLTSYALPTSAAGAVASTTSGGSLNGTLAADGQNGLWVPSSEGLWYFDRRTDRFTHRFQHEDANPHSIDSNAIFSVYQDRGGVLWVGTENSGLNVLNFRQRQFVHYMHRPADGGGLSPGRVKAIHEDRDGVVWVGFFPRALDRLDRKTGQVTHYRPGKRDENSIGPGTNVNSIYRDPSGYLWLGGGGSGLVRFDERSGRVKHYRRDPRNPSSLISNNVYTIYGDRSGRMWVGLEGGISRFDPATDGFVNYRPVPQDPASLANTVWVIHQDRSGALWAGTWGGVLIRFDDEAKAFVSYAPDSRDARRLNGGGINTILEDRAGTLWVGTFDGLYRRDGRTGAFARYTEREGLPSSSVRCIQEDRLGRLWLSTQKGVSRFDPRTGAFRNYDMSDGLQSDEFSTGCFQGPDGEIFFGGSNGFNAFFPDDVRDDPYVPPVVLTSFEISNKPVSIGSGSVLERAIPYVDSLTLSYRDNVFSFEFAALSYANSHKNRYRYRLEGFDPRWNQVDARRRLATYTNLDPGKYVFRVQGSNADGIWNEGGVALPLLITPPWWRTSLFRAFSIALLLALVWAGYRLRMRQLQHAFDMALEARVGERTRIARELHDTLLQSSQGMLLIFASAVKLLPERALEAKERLERALDQAAETMAEARDAVQGLRHSTTETSDLLTSLTSIARELSAGDGAAPTIEAVVDGTPRPLKPLVRDEVYRIAAEALRNAAHHAKARHVRAEIRHEERRFRLVVRDDGVGIDEQTLREGPKGHFGLHGMRERAGVVGGRIDVLTRAGLGTVVELSIPAAAAYAASRRQSVAVTSGRPASAHDEEPS